MMRRGLVLLALLALAGCGFKLPERPRLQPLIDKVSAAGATDLKTKKLDGGGLQVNGKLDGRAFTLMFPVDWDGKGAVVFTPGYSLPGSTTVMKIPDNLIENDLSSGMLQYAYLQGYAVGMSAYDKAGLGVQTGVENSYRLKQYLDRVGVQRTYVIGVSMGGNIATALAEAHPGEFAGVLAVCGANASFGELTGKLIDMRAVYDWYTAGTPYALPGSHELTVSALSPQLPNGLGWLNAPWSIWQIKRMFDPVMNLFAAAKKDPQGKEAQIIHKVSAITGWDEDSAAFALPLLTIGLGMDDMRETSGGNFYDNTAKVYGASILGAEEAAALNKGVARIKGDAQAIAYMQRWHDAKGSFTTPLLALHNSIDSLAPYWEATQLHERAVAAGNAANMALLTVPPLSLPMPFATVDGYMHCGFRPSQPNAAWDELRNWVENGKKPIDGDRP